MITIPARPSLANKPVRRCSRLTKSVNCCLCGKLICPGEWYRDGGLRRRAHDACVPRRPEDV